MVANLLERRPLSFLNDLVSILSLSKCAFVHVCVLECYPCGVHSVLMRSRTSRRLLFTWYRQIQPVSADCNQTIHQKSLDCYPPTPSASLSFLCIPSYSSLAELPVWHVMLHTGIYTVLQMKGLMKNVFSLNQKFGSWSHVFSVSSVMKCACWF